MREELARIFGTIIIGLVILIGTFAAIQFISNSPIWGPDGAAWVQAIGSIAALGVAIFIMSMQNAHAVKLVVDADKRALIRRASAVSALVSRTQEQIDRAFATIAIAIGTGDQGNLKDAIKLAKHLIAEIQDALNAIPTYELGSHDMAASIFELQDVVATSLITLNSWPEEQAPPMGVAATMVIMKKCASRAVTRFSRGLDELMNS